MAEVISGSNRINISVLSSDTNGAAVQNSTVTENEATSWANGTSAGEIDTCYAPAGTIAPAGSVAVDLDAGVVLGPSGDVQTFAEVQCIYLKNEGATNTLTISGDFLGLTTDEETVEPGGVYMMDFGTAGKAVVASSADNITVASTGGTTYTMVIVGRSA